MAAASEEAGRESLRLSLAEGPRKCGRDVARVVPPQHGGSPVRPLRRERLSAAGYAWHSALWPGFHEESHFGYVTTACGHELLTCTVVRRRGTPSSREARRSSATSTTCTSVAVVRPEGGSQVDLLPRRLPVRQQRAAGTFGAATRALMGCFGLARLAFLAP